MHVKTLRLSVMLLSLLAAFPVAAFDPNEGAEPAYAPARRLIGKPNVWHAPTSPRPPAVAPAPLPAPQPIAPNAAPIAYAPPAGLAPLPAAAPVAVAPPAPTYDPNVPYYSPSENMAPLPNQAAAPAYTPPPPHNYVAPISAPYIAPQQASSTSWRANRYALGLETFYDRYTEPDEGVRVDSRTGYLSATFDATHYFNRTAFGSFETRSSIGREHYHSVDGSSDGIRNYEFDNRFLAGYDVNYGQGRHFKPYIGLGARYYLDEFKGHTATDSLGVTRSGYDRRILQLYLPTGFAYEFNYWGFAWAPRVEFSPLLWGRVQSRFQNLGAPQATNHQHHGFGFRLEAPFGQKNANGFGWQFGPFIRYWDMDDSTLNDCGGVVAGPGFCLLEPENQRLQAGINAKLLF